MRYNTVEGSAEEVTDYMAVPSGTVVVASGQPTATFTVETVGDTVAEVTESFTIELTGVDLPDGVTLETATATATIHG